MSADTLLGAYAVVMGAVVLGLGVYCFRHPEMISKISKYGLYRPPGFLGTDLGIAYLLLAVGAFFVVLGGIVFLTLLPRGLP